MAVKLYIQRIEEVLKQSVRVSGKFKALIPNQGYTYPREKSIHILSLPYTKMLGLRSGGNQRLFSLIND